ncbi:hypothetical protein [Anaplasma ovis]|nr:hypothetical protein [Anaplasma ovis]
MPALVVPEVPEVSRWQCQELWVLMVVMLDLVVLEVPEVSR